MKGLFLTCPSCKKMLIKNAQIRTGTAFDLRCFSCGNFIHLDTRSKRIELSYQHFTSNNNETEDDDSDDVAVFF